MIQIFFAEQLITLKSFISTHHHFLVTSGKEMCFAF